MQFPPDAQSTSWHTNHQYSTTRIEPLPQSDHLSHVKCPLHVIFLVHIGPRPFRDIHEPTHSHFIPASFKSFRPGSYHITLASIRHSTSLAKLYIFFLLQAPRLCFLKHVPRIDQYSGREARQRFRRWLMLLKPELLHSHSKGIERIIIKQRSFHWERPRSPSSKYQTVCSCPCYALIATELFSSHSVLYM